MPVVNSRDVAEDFGKRHDHALRDIDEAVKKVSPNLGTPWFREVHTVNEQNGQEYRSFNLTRQGFTLLVMGWNGERAMKFKIRYIQATARSLPRHGANCSPLREGVERFYPLAAV